MVFGMQAVPLRTLPSDAPLAGVMVAESVYDAVPKRGMLGNDGSFKGGDHVCCFAFKNRKPAYEVAGIKTSALSDAFRMLANAVEQRSSCNFIDYAVYVLDKIGSWINDLTGGFVAESVFNVPGLGRYFVNAISARDYTLIMGVTVFYAALIITMNLICDILYQVVDPRIQMA